jgi:hypothetical protein
MNLRRKILSMGGINAQPWSEIKLHLASFPVSAKTLFKNGAYCWDIITRELIEEQYMDEDEELLYILRDPKTLKRYPKDKIIQDAPDDFGCIPEDWTEEDYEYFKKH